MFVFYFLFLSCSFFTCTSFFFLLLLPSFEYLPCSVCLSVCLSVFLPLTTSICVFLSICAAIDHGCLSLCLSLFLSASIFFCQFFVLHVSLTLYVYPLFDNYSSAILLCFCYFLATEDSYILTTYLSLIPLSVFLSRISFFPFVAFSFFLSLPIHVTFQMFLKR